VPASFTTVQSDCRQRARLALVNDAFVEIAIAHSYKRRKLGAEAQVHEAEADRSAFELRPRALLLPGLRNPHRLFGVRLAMVCIVGGIMRTGSSLLTPQKSTAISASLAAAHMRMLPSYPSLCSFCAILACSAYDRFLALSSLSQGPSLTRALGRFDAFAKPSANVSLMRTADGRSRRKAPLRIAALDASIGRKARLEGPPR
jgi:hypothetical protein